ncbi:hypothetical protein THOB06_320028 [Vibrio rotiferianus]|nr:hypothetical protein THOG10_320028 [Vibrio rotiferianus]CAH1584815.1 hypothetical protein THOB06_320028 [Vibrio rotiferianus]
MTKLELSLRRGRQRLSSPSSMKRLIFNLEQNNNALTFYRIPLDDTGLLRAIVGYQPCNIRVLHFTGK